MIKHVILLVFCAITLDKAASQLDASDLRRIIYQLFHRPWKVQISNGVEEPALTPASSNNLENMKLEKLINYLRQPKRPPTVRYLKRPFDDSEEFRMVVSNSSVPRFPLLPALPYNYPDKQRRYNYPENQQMYVNPEKEQMEKLIAFFARSDRSPSKPIKQQQGAGSRYPKPSIAYPLLPCTFGYLPIRKLETPKVSSSFIGPLKLPDQYSSINAGQPPLRLPGYPYPLYIMSSASSEAGPMLQRKPGFPHVFKPIQVTQPKPSNKRPPLPEHILRQQINDKLAQLLYLIKRLQLATLSSKKSPQAKPSSPPPQRWDTDKDDVSERMFDTVLNIINTQNINSNELTDLSENMVKGNQDKANTISKISDQNVSGDDYDCDECEEEKEISSAIFPSNESDKKKKILGSI